VTWWRERQALRLVARNLTQEFAALNVEGVGFHVRAHGRRSGELLVWPEGGLDNFVVPAKGPQLPGKPPTTSVGSWPSTPSVADRHSSRPHPAVRFPTGRAGGGESSSSGTP